MNTYLVTGSTGFIGSRLCHQLSKAGNRVIAFCRSSERAQKLFAEHNIEIAQGDITNEKSITPYLKGVDGVFHLAAYARQWNKDQNVFRAINVNGTLNLLRACTKCSVPRVVITSTAGVYGPSKQEVVDEHSIPYQGPTTLYEKTKLEADEKARGFLDDLDIVWIHPTRVFGPGELGESNSVTKVIKLRSEGRLLFLPGPGNQLGNYVYVDDVVGAEIKAMQNGATGEHYIIGGGNVSYQDFYRLIDSENGKRRWMLPFPIGLLTGFAKLQELRAKLTGRPPVITRPFVKKYAFHWNLSSEKAKTQLGFAPLPLNYGIKKTLDWLEGKKEGTP